MCASRKTTTVQSGMLNASTIVDGEYYTASTVLIKQSRRQDHLREILPNQSVQSSGHKVKFIDHDVLTDLFACLSLAMALRQLQSTESLTASIALQRF